MKKSNFEWLSNWYYSQCDGSWEHSNGVQIGTIDNPGWYLKVVINETILADKIFTKVSIDRSENDWIHCSINSGIFEGFGGPLNLYEILDTFRTWVENDE